MDTLAETVGGGASNLWEGETHDRSFRSFFISAKSKFSKLKTKRQIMNPSIIQSTKDQTENPAFAPVSGTY